MSTTTSNTTLTIVETAHLVTEIVEQLTDMGVTVHSAMASYDIAVQVADEDDVDRVAAEFDLATDVTVSGNYTREGRIRGVALRAYSGRARKRHSCPACDHPAAVSA
jgi:uncharacterized protein with GYD domain